MVRPEPAITGYTTTSWATERAAPWLAHADRLEAMLAPIDDVVIGYAGLTLGETVIDVGCGRGVTSRRAAVEVGRHGLIVGVDVAQAMIDAAPKSGDEPSSAPVEWIVADAATHSFGEGQADVVISRFGVMFFDDAVGAFTNLRRATRTGGRLAVAVWQPRDRSEFQRRTIDVAVSVAARHGVTLEPPEPDAGPFAFGVAERALSIVGEAGWAHGAFHPHVVDFYLGGPGTTPVEALAMGRAIGPLEVLLREVPEHVLPAIDAAVVADLETRRNGIGIGLPGAIAVVTAVA